MSDVQTRTARRPSPSALGERVRQLRIARGMTQTELGLGRFSKEYISQIERGRARPAPAALDWLAERLGTSRRFLETGLSSHEHERTVGLISRAEAAVAAREYEETLTCLDGAGALSKDWEPELALRAMLAGATARTELGRVKEALADARASRAISSTATPSPTSTGPTFSSTSANAATSCRRSRPPSRSSRRRST